MNLQNTVKLWWRRRESNSGRGTAKTLGILPNDRDRSGSSARKSATNHNDHQPTPKPRDHLATTMPRVALARGSRLKTGPILAWPVAAALLLASCASDGPELPLDDDLAGIDAGVTAPPLESEPDAAGASNKAAPCPNNWPLAVSVVAQSTPGWVSGGTEVMPLVGAPPPLTAGTQATYKSVNQYSVQLSATTLFNACTQLGTQLIQCDGIYVTCPGGGVTISATPVSGYDSCALNHQPWSIYAPKFAGTATYVAQQHSISWFVVSGKHRPQCVMKMPTNGYKVTRWN